MDFSFELYQLERTWHALGDVLSGDLLGSPRSYGYVALFMALTYTVAAVRARRVYLRATAPTTVDIMALLSANLTGRGQEFAVQSQLHEKLREDTITKLRTMMLCAAMAFIMFAVQAHVLLVKAQLLSHNESARFYDEMSRNDILFYTPSTSIPDTLAAGYYDMRMLFGFLAVLLVAVWTTSHFTSGEFDRPFTMRVCDWIADLVNPIEPHKPLNAVQRVFVWLRVIDTRNSSELPVEKSYLP